MNGNDKPKQVKVYLTDEHLERVRQYGRDKGILATTGINAGQPHVSEIIRLFIEERTEPLTVPGES